MEKLERILVWVLLAVVLIMFGAMGLLYLAGTGEPMPPETAAVQTEMPRTEPAPEETTLPERTEAAGPIRVACLGDSITYGHGISGRLENCYPARLGALLGEGYLVENFGAPGATAQDSADQPIRQEKAYGRCLEYDADIVILMLGTNDSKPDNWNGGDAFREALGMLLEELQAGEDPPEIWLCTPASAFFRWGKWGSTTSFDIQPEVVDTVAGIVREVAEAEGLPLIDIHALTSENDRWFEEDGVHPDEEGAAAIAEAVYAVLTEKP